MVIQQHPQPATYRPTILLVEDDAGVREVTERNLSQLGFQVHCATDGRAAMEILDSPQPIDLVCTDVMMPGGMTGYGVADAARQRRPGVKVVFITGYGGTGAPHGLARHPDAQMLHKPFTRVQLAAAIGAAFGVRQ